MTPMSIAERPKTSKRDRDPRLERALERLRENPKYSDLTDDEILDLKPNKGGDQDEEGLLIEVKELLAIEQIEDKALAEKSKTGADLLKQADKKTSGADSLPSFGKIVFQTGKNQRISGKLKKGLKQLGCQWSQLCDAYIFPKAQEVSVVDFLDENKRGYSIQAAVDHFHSSESEKRARELETQKLIIQTEHQEESRRLIKEVEQYNEQQAVRQPHWERVGESYFATDLSQDGKSDLEIQAEHDFRQRFLEQEARKAEIKDIEDQISHLSEESHQYLETLNALGRNEVGDAELFVKEFGDKYVFDTTVGANGAWYVCNKASYWERDRHKERFNDFEQVADRYRIASEETKDEKLDKALKERYKYLNAHRRRHCVLETASSYLSLRTRWDEAKGKLPCLNGILDLESGVLSDVSPDDFLTKSCQANYNPQAECPLFEKFMNDICLGDTELCEFIQRLLGYAIHGSGREEIIVILYGPDGRNGKGTLMKVLSEILGPLAHTFPAGMLLLQRNPPSSSSPSPEKANLEGCRLAIFSEINEGRKLDASEIKNMSGRDTITARRLFSNEDLQIQPSHLTCLQTNHLPEAPADDEALWERAVVIPFLGRFVKEPNPEKKHERPVDPALKEKLLGEKEGVLAWLVRGFANYQLGGLQIPEIVKQQKKDYRKSQDGIALFLEQECELGRDRSAAASDVQKAVKTYCLDNKLDVPKNTKVVEQLKKRFLQERTRDGNIWRGFSLKAN